MLGNITAYAFCGARVRYAKSNKLPQVLVGGEENGKKQCGGVELGRSELTRLAAHSSSLLEASSWRLH